MTIANQMQTIRADVNLIGTFTCSTLVPPDGFLDDAAVSATAAIAATKLVHQFPLSVQIADPSTTIAAATRLLHIVNGATATLVGIRAVCVTAPSGDHTVSVDLKKSTAGGAFASVLSATLDLSSSSTALTPVSGSISTASAVSTDLYELVVTVAGSTGSQGVGLLVTVFLREDPA